MLSLEDIKNVTFRRANFGGYKPGDVDEFIDDLQVSYGELLKEREKMISKIESQNTELEKYRSESNSIRDVISRAKQVAVKSLNDAEIESKSIISKAGDSAKELVDKAKKEVEVQTEISQRLKSEASKLKSQLEDIYHQHMEVISKIPGEVVAEKNQSIDIESEKEDNCQASKDETIDIFSNVSGGKLDDLHLARSREDLDRHIEDIISSKGIEEKPKSIFSDVKLKFGKNYVSGESEDVGTESDGGIFNGVFKR